MADRYRIVESADVAPDAVIGEGSSIWNLAQVRERAQVGRNCSIARGVYIGADVVVGDNCKIQNYAQVMEDARLDDGVFIGPSVVFTNDRYPRAINPDGSLKTKSDWVSVGVLVEAGASIGANATCVAQVTIGAWAVIAAGSVVVADVPAFALVAGVPARRIGWVGEAGVPLRKSEGSAVWQCPVTGDYYEETGSRLEKATG